MVSYLKAQHQAHMPKGQTQKQKQIKNTARLITHICDDSMSLYEPLKILIQSMSRSIVSAESCSEFLEMRIRVMRYMT